MLQKILKLFNNLQHKFELYYNNKIDKLEHFFLMSILLSPCIFSSIWYIKPTLSIILASVKEFIDCKFRGKVWDWQDWLYGVFAGFI